MTDAAATGTAAPGRRALAVGNMAWLLGDKAFALVVGLAIAGLIARSQGPVGSGHFAYASALLQIGLGLSLVCAGVALLPRFCRIGAALPGAIANVFALRLLASVIAAAIVAGYCWIAIDDLQRRMVSIVMLAAVPLIEPFYVCATYWLSRNHNRPTVIARSIGLLVRLVLVVGGLWLGLPLVWIAAAWVVESAINAALQVVQMRAAFPAVRWRRRVRLARMRVYLRFGLRFVPALWMGQIFIRTDRLFLAEYLPPEAFGLYAAPMQLVEVWAQVAYLVGSSIATAVLYRQVRRRGAVRAFAATALAMAGIGLAGLLAAWSLGPWMLGLVFGPRFDGSQPYLVAGAAFAVLLFADQAVEMLVTAHNRPSLLAAKWFVALAVAVGTIMLGFDRLGALVGPAALAGGLLAGWVALLLLRPWWPNVEAPFGGHP